MKEILKRCIVTFSGASGENTGITTIKKGLKARLPSWRPTQWPGSRRKLIYVDDPTLKDKAPRLFKLYAVPLPNER